MTINAEKFMKFFTDMTRAKAATNAAANTTCSSVSDVMSSVNSTLRTAGPLYSEYSCQTVSWDDVTRGTIDGSLSAWGANITDTRLYAKGGNQLYTVRTDNFNEKLGKVSAGELALITGNQAPGGELRPVTLRDVLRNMGHHGSYAGLDSSVDLSDDAADEAVSIRFMTTFLPVEDREQSTLEFAPEMYSYQSHSESDPANLLLLATSQGVAVQSNGTGATKMYHHAVDPSQKICRYWFEAERSTKQVGGAQKESLDEALAAAKRGKATASVIGTRSMGTRFNVLMTIQVPLKQQPRASMVKCSMLGAMALPSAACGYVDLFGLDSVEDVIAASECVEMDGYFSDDDEMAALSDSVSASPTGDMRSRSQAGFARSAPRIGAANAARVSRGSMVDRLDKTVNVKKPERDASQHVTVTVVLYNTVAGGVPSVEDVKAAVDDMEALYASCGWKGRLASEGADFMKKELTVKDTATIAEKLATQPCVPPTGSIGLMIG